MTRPEREVLEHAVHAVTEQAARANDLVDEVLATGLSGSHPLTVHAKMLLDGAREHRLGPLFTILATTGLRRGEALGLRWSDVDLDEGRLAVRQTLLAVNNQCSSASRRRTGADAPWISTPRPLPC